MLHKFLEFYFVKQFFMMQSLSVEITFFLKDIFYKSDGICLSQCLQEVRNLEFNVACYFTEEVQYYVSLV